MSGQSLAEGATTLHGIGDLGDGLLKKGIWFLLSEHGEAAQKGKSGIDQGCELTREDHECLSLDGLSLEERNFEGGLPRFLAFCSGL